MFVVFTYFKVIIYIYIYIQYSLKLFILWNTKEDTLMFAGVQPKFDPIDFHCAVLTKKH